ncbi:expressed unknown protein [Seminavis robusta]|uniref:Uncharacterized protein n=1 Tax=Seminavis robusta TaxID=568900 RepID=A0A9N8E4A4_9STRA|nr:expressed unknown protein [Seminavis robusta]|eukprot:Sro528_g160800.1 n/a (608) ;mRNA; f:18502-20325
MFPTSTALMSFQYELQLAQQQQAILQQQQQPQLAQQQQTNSQRQQNQRWDVFGNAGGQQDADQLLVHQHQQQQRRNHELRLEIERLEQESQQQQQQQLDIQRNPLPVCPPTNPIDQSNDKCQPPKQGENLNQQLGDVPEEQPPPHLPQQPPVILDVEQPSLSPAHQNKPVKNARKSKEFCEIPGCWENHTGTDANGWHLCFDHRMRQPQQPSINNDDDNGNGKDSDNAEQRNIAKKRKRSFRAKKILDAGGVLRIKKQMKSGDELFRQCQKFSNLQDAKSGAARQSNQRTSRRTQKAGAYVPGNDRLKDHPDHNFDKIQYHDDDVLTAMMEWEGREKMPGKSKIDVLGDGEHGIFLESSTPYAKDGFIHDIGEASRDIVLNYHDEEVRQNLLQTALISSRKCKVGGNDDKAPALFRAAEVHYNQHSTDEMQFMKVHKDKIGSMVTIYVLEGISWNFVVLGGQKGESGDFETDFGDYHDYVAWKNELKTLNGPDFKLVEEYEVELKRYNGPIIVYKLTPGQRLIFDALGYNHGVIVPGSFVDKEGKITANKRSVIVFHDLLPQWDGFKKVHRHIAAPQTGGTEEGSGSGSKRGGKAARNVRSSRRRKS